MGSRAHFRGVIVSSRPIPQVLAVKFEQVKGAQKHMPVIGPLAQLRKPRHALVIATHRLDVDQAGAAPTAMAPNIQRKPSPPFPGWR